MMPFNIVNVDDGKLGPTQMEKISDAEAREPASLDSTTRGDKGFGSTGLSESSKLLQKSIGLVTLLCVKDINLHVSTLGHHVVDGSAGLVARELAQELRTLDPRTRTARHSPSRKTASGRTGDHRQTDWHETVGNHQDNA